MKRLVIALLTLMPFFSIAQPIQNTTGKVLFIRHALAPGTGDPANFRIDNCATQRNLDDRGREQARAIGRYLKEQILQFQTPIYSSQWCRCLETAKLMDMGPVEAFPGLNSFYTLPEFEEEYLRSLKRKLAQLPSDGALVIMVTHQVTISAITNKYVRSGDGVLYNPKTQIAESFALPSY